jgi:hypothetical protein
MILSLAADSDLEIKQIDFDTAFLNAKLNHDVLHEKSCAVLRQAFHSALKDTPDNDARAAQSSNPTAFIYNNAHWLWEYAIKQFKPDPIGQIG